MSPSFKSNDSGNFVLTNSKLGCYFSLSVAFFVQPSYRANLIFCQFVQSVSLSSWLPSLTHLIFDIIKMCTEPKMGWIYASRIVSGWAIMKNEKPIWNGTIMENPRHYVSANPFITPASTHKQSVSEVIECSIPQPARISDDYLFPKSLYNGYRAVSFREKGIGMQWKYSIRSGIVGLHGKLSLLCQALGHLTAAGAHLFYLKTNSIQA